MRMDLPLRCSSVSAECTDPPVALMLRQAKPGPLSMLLGPSLTYDAFAMCERHLELMTNDVGREVLARMEDLVGDAGSYLIVRLGDVVDFHPAKDGGS